MPYSTSTRQVIEEAALRLLAREGLDGFTASRLAADAGVSKATLYHHFSSLDGIMLAAFERMTMGIQELTAPSDGAFRPWLLAMGEQLLDTATVNESAMKAYMAFFSRGMFDESMRGKIDTMLEGAVQSIVGLIETYFPEAVSPTERESAARLLVASLDGLVLHALMLPAKTEEIRASWHVFVEALASNGEPV